MFTEMRLWCRCHGWARGSVSLPNGMYSLSSGTPLCFLSGLQLPPSQEASLGDKVIPWGVSHSPGCIARRGMLMFEHVSSASIHDIQGRWEALEPSPKQRTAFGGHKSSARGRCRCLSVLQGNVATQTSQWPCRVWEAHSWLRLSPGVCSPLIHTILFYTQARECLSEIAWVETY